MLQGYREWGLWSVPNSSPLLFLPPHTFPLLLHGLSTTEASFSNTCLFQCGIHHGLLWVPAPPWSTSSPPSVLTFVSGPRLFLTLFSPQFSIYVWSFLPFLKPVFPEVPPPCLLGSAMPCGGVQLQPSGASHVWHWAAPASPHRDHPAAPAARALAPAHNAVTITLLSIALSVKEFIF